MSYKSSDDLDNRISGYEDAFQAERDSEGNIKKKIINGGSFFVL